MKTRVAIYGFGRLGRAVFTVATRRHDLEIVAIASDMSPRRIVQLLESDEIYAPIERTLDAGDDYISVGDNKIRILPMKLDSPQAEAGIDLMVDCNATVADNETKNAHIAAGAKSVVFAAPGKEIETIILGSNDNELNPELEAISCGGAVDMATRPVIDIIKDNFGVDHTLLTNISGVLTCDGETGCGGCGEECKCDSECSCKDFEITDTMPLPLLLCSVSEIIVTLRRSATVEVVNDALRRAAKEPFYQGIILTSDKAIAGDDAIGESFSGIVDLTLTRLSGGRLLSLKVWYDREWGYANRIVELAADFGKLRKHVKNGL